MAKQRKKSELNLAEIKRASDVCLEEIASCIGRINTLKDEEEAAAQTLRDTYAARIKPLLVQFQRAEAWLKDTMKSNKAVLFDGTDVVGLAHGSLIRSLADKVKIPRDAVERCEKLGFADAIKTVKTLDREAVEKWPDARLTLIGAERKAHEQFTYDLKEGTPCKD